MDVSASKGLCSTLWPRGLWVALQARRPLHPVGSCASTPPGPGLRHVLLQEKGAPDGQPLRRTQT